MGGPHPGRPVPARRPGPWDAGNGVAAETASWDGLGYKGRFTLLSFGFRRETWDATPPGERFPLRPPRGEVPEPPVEAEGAAAPSEGKDAADVDVVDAAADVVDAVDAVG